MEIKLNLNLVTKFLRRIHGHNLGISVVPQPPGSSLCWAACYRMVDWWVKKGVPGWCIHTRCGNAFPSCAIPCGLANKPRLTSQISSDWLALGYKSNHYQKPLSIVQVRMHLQERQPIMAYLSYRGESTGHYFLIIGTAYSSRFGDASYLVADPLQQNVQQIDVTELGQQGDWQQSWAVMP